MVLLDEHRHLILEHIEKVMTLIMAPHPDIETVAKADLLCTFYQRIINFRFVHRHGILCFMFSLPDISF